MAIEFLVETYLAFHSTDASRQVDARLHEATSEVAAEGTVIRFLRSIPLPSDETCLYLFEAESSDTVAEVLRRAGITPDRIVATGSAA
jgi:transcriptional regulator of met regulon